MRQSGSGNRLDGARAKWSRRHVGEFSFGVRSLISSPFRIDHATSRHREPDHQLALSASPAATSGSTTKASPTRSSKPDESAILRPHRPARKKGSKQLQFDTEWTQDRIEENEFINRIRARVKLWREGGYVGVTPTTARLLDYWTDPSARRSSSSARSRRSKPPSTSPRWPEIRRRLDREQTPRGQRRRPTPACPAWP